ncbi:uncharacterized protein LOC111259490 [Varroa jacobsoni]|uniref:Small ribosomal subunit protein uS7 domain-containing protein n=1 Tax=Varroa destructor TaxID=109461 RepID=A0A7M7KR78_VARDE|nr:uncharacterized protein LOC111253026 [Varroa destructor]XP_022687294.1 uncharacterized protein LOC111259490 [Varroa jacobsoni]
MAMARSAITCGLRAGHFAMPHSAIACGQFVRGSRYSPRYIDPLTADRTEIEEYRKTTEGQEAAFRPVKAVRSEVSNSVFYDPVLEKFTNFLMRKGDKRLATDLVRKALFTIKFIRPPQFEHPLAVLATAIENAKPALEMTRIKRGGITYQVPVPVKDSRARLLAIRWIIETAADKERHVRFSDQLAKELVDASQNVGRVIHKKQEMHKLAEANKAFAHYRWS